MFLQVSTPPPAGWTALCPHVSLAPDSPGTFGSQREVREFRLFSMRLLLPEATLGSTGQLGIR